MTTEFYYFIPLKSKKFQLRRDYFCFFCSLSTLILNKKLFFALSKRKKEGLSLFKVALTVSKMIGNNRSISIIAVVRALRVSLKDRDFASSRHAITIALRDYLKGIDSIHHFIPSPILPIPINIIVFLPNA